MLRWHVSFIAHGVYSSCLTLHEQFRDSSCITREIISELQEAE